MICHLWFLANYLCLQMILSSNAVATQLKTVSCYRMTLISCSTGQDIGCYPLMFQNVRCYTLATLPILAISYALDGIQLELLDNYRDLGIQIDSKLKFHIHTDTVVKKAYRVLGLIRKSFECKDYDVMVKLYKSLVHPIIEYNNVGPFYVSDNQKIERIQRKATRIIPSISHLSYHDRLRHLNLPSLQHRRRRGDLICLYQILKGAYDIDNQLFISSTVTITRGHTKKLFKQHTNSYTPEI